MRKRGKSLAIYCGDLQHDSDDLEDVPQKQCSFTPHSVHQWPSKRTRHDVAHIDDGNVESDVGTV